MNRMRGEWWPGPRLIVEGAPQREKEKKRKGRGRKEMGHGWPDKGWSLLCPTPRRWSKNDKQSHWLSDWLTDRLIHGLIDSLTDLLTDSLTDWLSHKVIQWRTYWLTDRLTTFDLHSTQQVSPVLFYTIYPDQLSSAQHNIVALEVNQIVSHVWHFIEYSRRSDHQIKQRDQIGPDQTRSDRF